MTQDSKDQFDLLANRVSHQSWGSHLALPTPGVTVWGGAPNSMLEGGTKKNIKDMHLLSLKESQELLYGPLTFVLLAQT